ncbi:MAG: hypothetical protein ACI9R3_005895 [Verrucomicrobiales bacterium]|jgi:hypothetical protein
MRNRFPNYLIHLFLLPLTFAASLAGAGESATPQQAEALSFFESKIRPVLAERCYSCHSDQAEKLKAGLYLDGRENIVTGGDTGPAIVPGKPEQSLLIEAIRYHNVDLQMPPKDKLDARVVADFETWISWGAPWPEGEKKASRKLGDFDLEQRKSEHWAWQPVTNPAAPEIANNDWSSDPIDRFVLAKLQEADLRPGAATDRRTLIRRVTFDLTGLPPTTEEVAAFVADASDQAYDKVVTRLLDSPHFGERWARHWLDMVRYAETRGHEFDHEVPNAFRYRDYVIRAFNADIPYNQFVTEHLAGDLMPEPRLHPEEKFNESVIGTGFWFLGESIHSPVDIKQDEADRFDNMVDVAAKSFMSLTVACARCHDHKFDAISTKDYYAMFGYLQSSNYHQAPIDSMLPNKTIADELREISRTAKQKLANIYAEAFKPALQNPAVVGKLESAGETEAFSDILQALSPSHSTEWAKSELERAQSQQSSWDTLDIIADYATIDENLFIQDGGHGFGISPVRPGSFRLTDKGTRIETYGAARRDLAWSNLEVVDSTLDPASKTTQQPGRMLRSPTFVLQAPGTVHYLVRGNGLAMAVVDSHRLVLGPLHGNVHRKLNSKDGELRWESHPLQRYIGHNLHIELVPEGDAPFEILAIAQSKSDNVSLPRPDTFENPPMATLAQRIQGKDDSTEAFAKFLCVSLDQWQENIQTDTPLAPEFARAIDWMLQRSELFFDKDNESLASIERIVSSYLKDQSQILSRRVQKSRTVLAMMDGTPLDDSVYIRGSYKSPGERVSRRFLEALGGTEILPPQHGSGRLELAEQITHPDNPFVSRSIVNRLWHHLFGRGIVPTTDDFGALGQPPSHPELLDHLAHSFVADGWSIKRQIHRIVMTRSYQMASTASDPEAELKDPQNRWLHRASVRRLQSESIRDALLAVSGRLNPKAFGRSVPVNLTDFMTGRGRPGKSGPLDGDGRRSIYLEVRRNFLNPMMLAFDTPIPFAPMGRRSISNVPSQALIMMNDPLVIQQAGVWTKRILALPKLTTAQRIDRMYQEAFARPATTEEIQSASKFLEADTDSAADQRWTDFAHVLFNTKEFIFLN